MDSRGRSGKQSRGVNVTAKVNTKWMKAAAASESPKPVGSTSLPERKSEGGLRLIHESGGLSASEASAAQQSKPPVVQSSAESKQSLCVDILTKGYVNSFVDFFYLTHRLEDDKNRKDIPDEDLAEVQENLVVAERSHRRADTTRILASYEKLARYFQEHNDYRTSIYFYEKCLDIAENTGNLGQQGIANNNLGVTHDALGEMALAVKFHEKHLQIALQMKDDERIIYANKQLIDVYRRFAEDFERKTDVTAAIEHYEKCLQAALDCSDLHNEGVATYRLGVSFAKTGNLEKAIKWQHRYMEICKQTGDQLGEGAACSALAACSKEAGDMKQAARYLEKYHDIAARNKQPTQQAEACSALGLIASDNGQHERAVAYFEKAFDIARNINDRRLMDAARINLGMSQGNVGLRAYMHVVNEDLPTLLNWKARRIDFK